jgi:GTP cyclohydrolase II
LRLARGIAQVLLETPECGKLKPLPGRVEDRLKDGLMIFSSDAKLPTTHGNFRMRVVRDQSGAEHAIVFKGVLDQAEDLPVRVHSECLTGEVFSSQRCDCDQQLGAALDYFEEEGNGLLIYLRQEGRGIGLFNKIEAYSLQDAGLDTIEANHELGLSADSRSYQIAVKILGELGIRSVRLLTNNPLKIEALRLGGVEITSRVPVHCTPNNHNSAYLQTKKLKMAHLL